MTSSNNDTRLAREQWALDTAWRFHLGETDRALDDDLDDSDWEDVRLPHDWALDCPTDPDMDQGVPQGFHRRAHVGWYRRRLRLDPEPGRRHLLRLDGVYRHAEVWINGESLGLRPSGYATRIHDVTEHLRADGDQLIAVRCDNTAHDADRWYCGAGIYRRVWLTTVSDLSVAPWGVFVTTPEITSKKATVSVEVTVRNDRADAAEAKIECELLDPDGSVCGSLSPGSVQVQAGGQAAATLSGELVDPALWSPESPSLYTARLRVLADGAEVDRVSETFGVRHFDFSADEGFILNGTPRKMKGVCLHHDLGCLGVAFFKAGWERRLRLLKELGFDSIRTSHNPPDPGLLDLCDRLGFLVIDEAFDKWREGCSGEHFEVWWREDLEAMVLRDRNHPSVIVWSVGNEVEQQGTPEMIDICARLAGHVRSLDPTRPTTVGLRPFCNMPQVWQAPPEKKAEVVKAIGRAVDIVGLNYQDQWYDAYRRAMPERVFIATEAFHFFQHCTNASWAMHAENPWFEMHQAPHVVGQFLWTGIDYLGEATQGWPVRGWMGAPVDSAGFAKPRAWWHASVWRSEPVVRAAVRFRERDTWEPADWSFPPLVDHWNLPVRPGEVVEVWVFSNGHSVELLLDGASKGKRIMAECPNRIASFFLPWAPGTLEAVSCDEDGNELARHALATAGEPARVELSADRQTLRADDQDLAHVTVTIVDEHGVRVPHADNPVGVEALGAARLIGMDNGDLRCHEPYRAMRRSARGGRCVAVVRAGHSPGPVTVTAIVPGLPSANLELHVVQK